MWAPQNCFRSYAHVCVITGRHEFWLGLISAGTVNWCGHSVSRFSLTHARGIPIYGHNNATACMHALYIADFTSHLILSNLRTCISVSGRLHLATVPTLRARSINLVIIIVVYLIPAKYTTARPGFLEVAKKQNKANKQNLVT